MGLFTKGSIWYISFADVDGIIRKRSAKTKIKKEAQLYFHQVKSGVAEQRRQRFLKSLAADNHLVNDKRTMYDIKQAEKIAAGYHLSDLLETWIQRCEGNNMPNVEKIRARFQFIVDMLGGPTKLVEQITGGDIDKFKKKMLTQPINKRGKGRVYTPATVNRHLSILKGACNLAIVRGLIKKSPMAGVKLIPENNERDRLCKEEELALFKVNASEDMWAMILIAYHTAMRQNEIRSLLWSDIELETQGQELIKVRLGNTKTKEARAVPVHEDVVALLKQRQKNQSPQSKQVFPGRYDFSRAFAKLCRDLKIDNLKFHDLRHTAITAMRRRGWDLLTIKQISGHKTMKMLERYNTFDHDDIRETLKDKNKDN